MSCFPSSELFTSTIYLDTLMHVKVPTADKKSNASCSCGFHRTCTNPVGHTLMTIWRYGGRDRASEKPLPATAMRWEGRAMHTSTKNCELRRAGESSPQQG